MRCPECGAENADGSAFCCECGSSLTGARPAESTGPPAAAGPVSEPTSASASPPATVACPECGAENSTEATWCAACHASLWQARRAALGPAALPEPAPAASPSMAKACPGCGAPIPAWRDRCERCAERAEATTPPMPGERPGCVTAYVVLQGIGVVLLIAAAVILLSGGGQTALAALALVQCAVVLPIMAGLWLMKNWARVAAICFQVLTLVSGAISLFTLLGGYGETGGACSSALGLALSCYVIYWFASHRDDFAPPRRR